ncbi:hypothetical protein DPMN_142131 [Dreissena polymorpha]|uniref:Uncharacterized protein n=1 Tax=Dreissena polymorpha TaxID=45954 RepID=A0A9D4JID0_DREPO|nr:hypothetical protein DPMN_142131 [Dreissena polymorpha]
MAFHASFPHGCTTDKHQLFVPFMARLSGCIFQIDQGDYFLLMRAKREELLEQGVPDPSDKDVPKHITFDEVGRHCKRATRGIEETMSLIQELIASLDSERGK